MCESCVFEIGFVEIVGSKYVDLWFVVIGLCV